MKLSKGDMFIYGLGFALMIASFVVWLVYMSPIFIADFVTIVAILLGYESVNMMTGEWDV